MKHSDAVEMLGVLDQHVVPRLEGELAMQISGLEAQVLAAEQRVGSRLAALDARVLAGEQRVAAQLREARFPVDEKTFVKLIKSMDTLLDRTTALAKRLDALEQRKAD